ncbi:hypothetical protein [Carboxylicivirga taeanensis]|uniref:hypothetical protein n=1 Tax=Carboxylicivirga taeanensis TaxID=1416875 RepID=UPI003F6DCB82
MMKTLLHIGFLLISFSSFAQFDKLTIDFKPSFIESSRLTIQQKSDDYLLTLETADFSDKSIVSDSALLNLSNYLRDYDFAHKGSIDTIGQETVIENGDTTVYYHLSMGTDGINVYGEVLENDQKKTFKFWSPDKEDTNHELIEILFSLMYTKFNKQKTVTYLEQLEQYFDFGLGLRKLHDNPLTFKLYGSISSNELDELYAFFDSLPVDKKVFIDMSNFNGMGTMFDEDFLELSESHKLIKWINCSENAKLTLKRAEIKKNRYK